jgi:hypothetical protein
MLLQVTQLNVITLGHTITDNVIIMITICKFLTFTAKVIDRLLELGQSGQFDHINCDYISGIHCLTIKAA